MKKIPIGSAVRLKRDITLHYGDCRTELLPAGSTGTVEYRPKDEDPQASFDIGVFWHHPDGCTVTGMEVNESDVELI